MRLACRHGLLLVATLPAALRAAAPPDAGLRPGEKVEVSRAASELGLPEVAALLVSPTDAGAMERLAAMYAAESQQTEAAGERAMLVGGAERAYEAAVERRERDPSSRNANKVAIARCRVAWASTVLRVGLSRELDRQEITSGLAVPGEMLAARLDQCIGLFQRAEAMLAGLSRAMAADEERFLLEGLADSIRALRRECRLNLSWARTWRAGMAQRARLSLESLTEAERGFDAARQDGDAAQRQDAAIGLATVRRMLRRFDDALAVLNQLKGEALSRAAAARVDFEKARTLLAAERFADARAALRPLIEADARAAAADDAGGRFYVLVAPFLLGDSYLLEHAAGGAADLQRRGVETLTALLSRGGEWPEYVDIYLAARGVQRDRTERTAAELILLARRAMDESRFADAVPLWKTALSRQPADGDSPDARYNLGVCLFQTERLDDAAAEFESVASIQPPHSLSDTAMGYAYRCRAEAARSSRDLRAWAALAKTCRLLVERFPKHADAAQAEWLEPLALQEARQFAAARAAFERVPRGSLHYWESRVGRVACRQAEIEGRRAAASGPGDVSEWNRIADDWLKLGDDLDAARRKNDANVDARIAVDVRLRAVEVLASESCGRFRDALAVLASLDTDEKTDASMRGRMLALRVRCHRGLGQFEQAASVLDEYLKTVPSDKVGDVLLSLSAGMEAEVERLSGLQRTSDARRVAVAAVPTLRELLAWIERQEGRQKEIPIVRMSLVRMLEQAGQSGEALTQLEHLMKADPGNGLYLRRSARLTEQMGRGESGSARSARLIEAERLWSKLLSDGNLRLTSPETYWEARYRWLRLRLEAGHADEVARGIAAEQAWVPDLGGAPWQGRLLELAEEARKRR